MRATCLNVKFFCKACLVESFRQTLVSCSWEGKPGYCLKEEKKNVRGRRFRESKKISK